MNPDRVEIYLDKAREFRWSRVAPNGRIIADSGQGYSELSDCFTDALRVNGHPYNLKWLTDQPPQGLAPVLPAP